MKTIKRKLLIIPLLIVFSSKSYSTNEIFELSTSGKINFTFEVIDRNNLNKYDSNKHIHGTINHRYLPSVFTSKYRNIIIISNYNENKISYNSGLEFNKLNIKDISNVNIISLSNDGRYALGNGHKQYKSKFFIYDTYLDKINILSKKDNTFDLNKEGIYLESPNSRYTLYSDDELKTYDDYIPYDKKQFFIYDNINKKSIHINNIEDIGILPSEGKERFLAYKNLTLPDNINNSRLSILGSTFDNNYFYGTQVRDNQKNKEIKLAFFYDRKNERLNLISSSQYGSSKINSISKNNIAVGWLENRYQHNRDERLYRQAFHHNILNNKTSILASKITGNNPYANSEATDISDDGNIIIGWSESMGLNSERNAFAYYLNNDNTIFFPHLSKNNSSSEAYSLSKDGHVVFGVSKKGDDQWANVVWTLAKDTSLNSDFEKIDIKYGTILAKNNIYDAQKNINIITEKLNFSRIQFNKQKEILSNDLRVAELKRDEAKRKKIDLGNIIEEKDKADKNNIAGYNAHIDEYNQYEDEENTHQNRYIKIENDILALTMSSLGKELKRNEYEYNKSQITLNLLQGSDKKIDPILDSKEPVDSAKTEQDRLAKEQRDNEKTEQERLAKEQRDNEKAEQERLAKEQRDNEKAEQERLAKEQRDNEKAKQERLAKEQRDNEKAEQDRLAKEQEAELQQHAKGKEKSEPSIQINQPIDIENTYKSMQLMAENGYKLIDMQQGQLRFLTSATCNIGTEKACISGFTHHQRLNKANATQSGLSGAYRFDINHIPLVVGLAIDTDMYSSLPKGYTYQGYPLPLIGFSLDLIPSLNPEAKNNALHMSLKGAYLNRKVSIERARLENTEAGKGQAKLAGYHLELAGYYPYSVTPIFTLTPFAGLTLNEISRSAYSETQGANFVAHYDKLKEQILSAKLGLGVDYLLGSSFILNTKAGLLWGLSEQQRDFRSNIDYLGQQHIEYSDNKKTLKQRPFANVGVTYQWDKHSSLGTSADWEMTTHRYHNLQLGVNYTYRF